MTGLSQLILSALPGVPLIQPGDDLADLILAAMQRAGLDFQAGDVLVLAQKVVSKAEGRLFNLKEVQASPRARDLARQAEKDPRLVELVLRESTQVLRIRPGLIVVEHRLGFVCANAGVDHSNVEPPEGKLGEGDEWYLLLPANPDQSAAEMRRRLQAETGLEALGVIINDSHGRAWRTGTVGVALGVAGFPALKDMRGHPDLFDQTLQVTQIGLADELAAAASLLMGQADEGRPVIHVRGVPYGLREGSVRELLREPEQDLFR
jgi:coenzyme F420-0:L-glutamate ligase/coenzyme F420-1:gamma-L-glutamate ligase